MNFNGQIHILLADDEQPVLDSLQFILESAGYLVSVAGNGLQALKKLLQAMGTSHPVNLLVTRIHLSGMAPREWPLLLQKIYPDLPVLFTGNYDRGLDNEMYWKGRPAAYLSKPFDAAELLRAVDRLLQNKMSTNLNKTQLYH